MRISFRNRNLGYPLLTPEPQDYIGGRFDIAEPEAFRNSGGVTLHISYQLESEYLNQLVAQGDAKFQTLIESSATFLREATPKTGLPEQQHTLDLGRYAGTVEMMPFLTAAQRIDGFACDEHHPEFRLLKPDGFTIEPAMILAVGDIHEVDIDKTANASSVVDFQKNEKVAPGEFRIDLTQPQIIVYLSPADFQTVRGDFINAIHEPRRQTIMWPTLYLFALTEGIRGLTEAREEGNAWTAAFDRALQKSGIDSDNELDLRNKALEYAQRIIFAETERYPLGLMLDAFAAEDGDYQDGASDE